MTKEIMDNIIKLAEEKKFKEVVIAVDQAIKNVDKPQEKQDCSIYYFSNHLEFFAYINRHKEEKFKWGQSDVHELCAKKLFALVELKELDAALLLADEMLKSNPESCAILFEKLEIYKHQINLQKFEEVLKQIYNFTVTAYDFARCLREYAWLHVEKKDYESAVHFLSLSLCYNNSQFAFGWVMDELKYIQKQTNNEIVRPEYSKSCQYLKDKNLPFAPTDKNRDICFDAYVSFLQLSQKENVNPKILAMLRDNLVKINRNNQEIAESIDVYYTTNNKLIINYDYGFSFQVDKSYTEIKNNNDINASDGTLHHFYKETKEGRHDFLICRDAFMQKEEDFEKLYRLNKESMQKQGLEVVNECVLECINGITAKKLTTKDKAGQLFVNYFFKLRPNLFGTIGCSLNSLKDQNEVVLVDIINSWSYIGEKKNNLQIFMNKIFNYYSALEFLPNDVKENEYKATMDDIAALAETICPIENKQDPFWEVVVRNFIKGSLVAMLESKDRMKNFTLHNLKTLIENMISDNQSESKNKLENYFNNKSRYVKELVNPVLTAADKTLNSYFGILKEKLTKI